MKESGAITHRWQASDCEALSNWDAQAQLKELPYRALINLSCPESRACQRWSAEWIRSSTQIDIGCISRMIIVLPSLCAMLGQTKHLHLLALGSLFAEFISCKHQFQKWMFNRKTKTIWATTHQTYFINPDYEHTISWWYGTHDTVANSGLPSPDGCGWKLEDDEWGVCSHDDKAVACT